MDILLLIMNRRVGIITFADSFKILGPIFSSPVDFLTFKFNKKISGESLIRKGDLEVSITGYF